MSVILGNTAAAPMISKSNRNTGSFYSNDLSSARGSAHASSKLTTGGINTKTRTATSSNASPTLTLPPIHPSLANSSNSELRKLAEYEQVLGGSIISRMMIFTEIPGSPQSAQSDAADMASTLKEFALNGIQSLVIMEPTINGNSVNFQNYRNGSYDAILDAYFGALKAQGISDTAMGVWTYFPEADLPEWGPVDIADFAPNVTRTVQLQKKYFPASQSSIMLDAESYPAGDTGWDSGSYTSLTPFINGIPNGLLDSFGLQGFPWSPPAGGTDTSYDSAQFLNTSIAIQAAQQLGVTSVWLNTGTFGSMYTQNSSQTVNMSPTQRQLILNGVIQQALSIKAAGLSVSVNLFSQDKSSYSEATDWSYWKTGAAAQSPAAPVLANFADQLYNQQIGLWLFDTL